MPSAWSKLRKLLPLKRRARKTPSTTVTVDVKADDTPLPARTPDAATALTAAAPAVEVAAIQAEVAAAPAGGCPFHKIPPAAPGALSDFPRVPAGAKLKSTKWDRTQADVDELLKEHAQSIAALAAKVSDHPHYDATLHDEIFLLRFVLSNGADKAEEPLRHTLSHRHAHRERLAQAASGYRDPKHDEMGKLSIADLLPVSTLLDEPVLVVRPGRDDHFFDRPDPHH